MITSSGIIIKYQNKVLLAKPAKSGSYNCYSFPKGHVEQGESLIETAIRECNEEVGILIDKNKISENFIVDYTKKNSEKVFKRVHLFLVEIEELKEIGMFDEVVAKKQLQKEEISWAGFLTKKEAKDKIFWRFKKILDYNL